MVGRSVVLEGRSVVVEPVVPVVGGRVVSVVPVDGTETVLDPMVAVVTDGLVVDGPEVDGRLVDEPPPVVCDGDDAVVELSRALV